MESEIRTYLVLSVVLLLMVSVLGTVIVIVEEEGSINRSEKFDRVVFGPFDEGAEDAEESISLKENTYDLKFIIIDEEDDPIEGANVTLNDMENTTDEEGEVLFRDLEAGEYNYTVEKTGYETVERSLIIDDDVEEYVTLKEVEFEIPRWMWVVVIPVVVLLIAVALFLMKRSGEVGETDEEVTEEESQEV